MKKTSKLLGLLLICQATSAQAALTINFYEDPGSPGSAVIEINGSFETTTMSFIGIDYSTSGDGTSLSSATGKSLSRLTFGEDDTGGGSSVYLLIAQASVAQPDIFTGSTTFTFLSPTVGVNYSVDGYGLYFGGTSGLYVYSLDQPDTITFTNAVSTLSTPWSSFINTAVSYQSDGFTSLADTTSAEWQINVIPSAVPSAVPEPSTVGLLGFAATGLFLRRRRRVS